MRFVTFSDGGSARAGVFRNIATGGEEQILDLGHPSIAACLAGTAPDLRAMIEAGLPEIVARIGALGSVAATGWMSGTGGSGSAAAGAAVAIRAAAATQAATAPTPRTITASLLAREFPPNLQ